MKYKYLFSLLFLGSMIPTLTAQSSYGAYCTNFLDIGVDSVNSGGRRFGSLMRAAVASYGSPFFLVERDDLDKLIDSYVTEDNLARDFGGTPVREGLMVVSATYILLGAFDRDRFDEERPIEFHLKLIQIAGSQFSKENAATFSLTRERALHLEHCLDKFKKEVSSLLDQAKTEILKADDKW